MSAYNSGFVTGTNSMGSSGLAPFIPVHERPEELIDGGQANEHYHLTQAEHTKLLSEGFAPVMVEFDLTYTSDGDLVIA